MALISSGLDRSPYPSLLQSYHQSRELVHQFSSTLEECLRQDDQVLTIAAAGSIGRLEAADVSDIDSVVIVDELSSGSRLVVERIFEALAVFGLKAPKQSGIFLTPIHVSTLVAPGGRGALDETPAIFGKRIQLLLDARPLYAESAFNSVRRRILEWYAEPFVRAHPDSQWTLLINDLQRYLHAYAGWQQYKFERREDDGWYLRQAKLRGSRVITFAGLVLLLGASSWEREKIDWLDAHLHLTPLERVHYVMNPLDAGAFSALIEHYEAVHAALTDAESRAELIMSSPGNEREASQEYGALYGKIHRHTAEILRVLGRFVLSRRDDWHPDFFSYLLF